MEETVLQSMHGLCICCWLHIAGGYGDFFDEGKPQEPRPLSVEFFNGDWDAYHRHTGTPNC